MIHEHIEQLLNKVEHAQDLPEATKADLLKLIAALQQEAGDLSATAQKPPVEEGTATASPEVAEEKPELIGDAIRNLSESVEGLETSHPELTSLVNRIAVTLSNMGI